MTRKKRPEEESAGQAARSTRRKTARKSSPAPAAERPSQPDAAARMREIEDRLDRMIDEHARTRTASEPPPPPPSSRAAIPPADSRPSTIPPPAADSAAYAEATASPDLPEWDPPTSTHHLDVDDFGYDPAYERRVLPLFDFLYEKYFRVETDGIDWVPATGRCLLVANHSGTVPIDGMMLRIAVKKRHPAHRDVRWLAEDAIFHFPFLGNFTNRVGAVRACQENAERLLEHDSLVAVFPEGTKGIGKLFKDRYKLQRFGRGGFVKLALRTRTPIVPVAIVGGEETNPMLARIGSLTKGLGIPYVPVTPTFPALGPVGLIPAPTKWRIVAGEPVDLEGATPEAADDEILVGRLTERVRSTIQGMLHRALAVRRSVWFG